MAVRIFAGVLTRIAASAEMKAVQREAGHAIADNVRAQGITVNDLTPGTSYEIALPVTVQDDGTVTIDHPAGIAVQAKHGALTKAASAAGLRVSS